MINYHFDEEKNILMVKFTGEVTIKEMLKYIIEVRENQTLPQRLKIFSDGTNGKFAERVNREDLVKFLEENKITLSQREFIFDAFVVSRSFETALGMLYKEFNTINNYKFDVFSTKEAALNWLQNVS